jgi:hypothetical protein
MKKTVSKDSVFVVLLINGVLRVLSRKDSDATGSFIGGLKKEIFALDKEVRVLEVFYERLEDKFKESQKTIGKLRYKLRKEKSRVK